MSDEFLPVPPADAGQMLIYRDGAMKLQVRLDGQTVWLTQAAMAELYQTTPQNVTIHIKGIYEDGEQDEAATCKEFLQVRVEGGRRSVVRSSGSEPQMDTDSGFGVRGDPQISQIPQIEGGRWRVSDGGTLATLRRYGHLLE